MQSIAILFLGWLLDKFLGDPSSLPHPVVGFGKAIAWGERRLNRGGHRRLKGGLLALVLIVLTYVVTHLVLYMCARAEPQGWLSAAVQVVLIFFCLAGTTLIREVRMVFEALERSLDDGRRQVARIVGRDTSQLSAQEIRKAALETLAENLSDGVIAPLFWFVLLGVPGMMTYKMVNTLDSMIGYRTERYRLFGTVAARIDDLANYVPARLTALLMIIVALKPRLLRFVLRFGPQHASPNSGWPEAALAGILGCQFGGPHVYFGELIDKPFIGTTDRALTTADMHRACRINFLSELLMLLLSAAALCV